MSETPADIEAEITFLPTEQGGRQGPARSGYRPQLNYDGHDWDAVHVYPDRHGEREWVHPGETVRALLSFLSPAEHVRKLRPGTAFEVREGRRVVGHGTVTRVLGLEASARRALEERT